MAKLLLVVLIAVSVVAIHQALRSPEPKRYLVPGENGETLVLDQHGEVRGRIWKLAP